MADTNADLERLRAQLSETQNPYDDSVDAVFSEGEARQVADAPDAGIIPKDANPYDDSVDAVFGGPQDIKNAMSIAVDKNPDEAAQVLRMSKEYGADPDVIDFSFKDLKRQSDLDSFDYEKLERQTPATASFLKNPYNAAAARDDVGTLSQSEKHTQDFIGLSDLYRGGVAALANFAAFISEAPALYDKLGKVTGNRFFKIASDPNARNNVVARTLRENAPSYAGKELDLGDALDELKAGNVDRAVRITALKVVEQSPSFVVGIGATLLGAPNVGLSLLATSSASQQSQRAEDAGVSLEAQAGSAVAYGASEALFEKLGTLTAFKQIGNAFRKRFGEETAKQFLPRVFRAIGFGFLEEGTEEAATEVVQKFTDYALDIDPDALKKLPAAALESFALGGLSSGAMTAPTAIGIEGLRMRQEKRQAQLQKDFYQQQGELANGSKLLDRSPEAFEDAISQMNTGTAAETVHVDVNAIDRFYQSQGLVTAGEMQKLGLLKEYEEAKYTTGEMRVPYAKWMTRTAKTPLYQAVADDVRFGDRDSVNGAKEAEARVEEEAKKAQEAPAPEPSPFRTELVGKFVAAGVTQEEAEANADEWERFYARQGQVMGGLSAEEAFRALNPGGVDVRGEDPRAGMAQNEPPELPENIELFQDGIDFNERANKVIDAEALFRKRAKELGNKLPAKKRGKKLKPEPSRAEQFANRYGDDQADQRDRVMKAQDPAQGPYVSTGPGPIGYAPNFAAEPTGVIGPARISEPHDTDRLKGVRGEIRGKSETDPLKWADVKWGATKQLLLKHREKGIPVTVNTSSDLIGHDDYIEALPEGSTVNMYLLSADDQINRVLFPGNPSRLRQEETIKRLREKGVTVNAIEPTVEDLIKAAGGKRVIGKLLGVKGAELVATLERATKKDTADVTSETTVIRIDPSLRPERAPVTGETGKVLSMTGETVDTKSVEESPPAAQQETPAPAEPEPPPAPEMTKARSSRYGLSEGNLWVTTSNGLVGVGTTKEESRASLEAGGVKYEVRPADAILRSETFQKAMLVVGTSSWLRQNTPFFLLQNYDIHILMRPSASGQNAYAFVMLARNETARDKVVALTARNPEQALRQLVGVAIHEADIPLMSGNSLETDPPQPKNREKRQTWVQNAVYRSPKVSLKDVLSLEPTEGDGESSPPRLFQNSRPLTVADLQARFTNPTPEEFLAAQSKSKRSSYLSSYTPEQLSKFQLFLSDEGVGFALTPEMDLVGVFNNSDRKGAGQEAVIYAIALGAKTLDAFEPFLPSYYNAFGFTEVRRDSFNDQYAPEGWNYETQGRPDVVYLAYPDTLSRDPQRIAERLEAVRAERRNAATGDGQRGGDPRVSSPYALIDWTVRGDGAQENAPTDPRSVGADRKGLAPRGSIDLLPDSAIIRLGQLKNESTLLHESGHLFLKNQGQVIAYLRSLDPATLTPQQQKAIADGDAILSWLGVESWDQIRTEHHEKWARGWEAFHFKGEAPSEALRSAFRRFTRWLRDIYQRMQALNVELTPEIEDVMKRLVATEEEIAEAENTLNAEPLFPDPASLGLTGDRAERYRRAMTEAAEESIDRLNQRKARDLEKKRTAEYRARRSQVEALVTEEASQNPLYVASDFLTENPEATSDLAAELFGFSSGDELTKKLEAAPDKETFIREETDRRMKEEFSEVQDSPTELSEAAMAALHNEKRAELLRMELEILTQENLPAFKDVVRAATRRPMGSKVIRERAVDYIGRQKVRDIRPIQFKRAESKAAREAVEALNRGDFQAVVDAKERQLLNFELYRAAVEAQDRVESGVEYLRRFNKGTARERLGKAGEEYLEQVDALLERFEFRRVSNREIEKRKSLAKFVENQRALGLEPLISDELLNEAYRTNYKEMTPAQLEDLRESVENIEHLARLKNKLLKAKKFREVEEAVASAVQSINDNSKGKRKQDPETRLPSDEASRLWKGFFASQRKFASYMRQMDGFKDGGVMWELFVRPMNEAANQEAVMNEEATMKLQELFALYSKSEQLTFFKKQYIPEIDASLSKQGLLMVALNWGNLDNRTKLMAGNNWTEEQVQALLDRLDERDWKWVTGIWRFIDTYWAETRAIAQRTTGVPPEKVESAEVVTKFGVFEGGYFPLKYDDRQSPRAFSFTAKEAADRMMRGGAVRATTKHGHRKERVEGVELPVRLDMGVIFEHVAEVIHDQTHYEMLIDLNRLMGDKRVQRAILDNYGDVVYDQLRKTVDDVAAGGVPATLAIEKVFNYLRAGVSISAMGWNLMTAIQQPMGITQSIVRVGPKYVARAIGQLLGSPAHMNERVKEIYEKSSFMRLRAKTQSREIAEIRNSLSKRGILLGELDGSFFYLIAKGQMLVDVPTWMAAYEKAMEEQEVGDPEAMEARAIELADQAVIDSQGSGFIKDLSQIQRGSPLLKLWTNFISFFNTTYNLTAESFGRTKLKDPASVALLAADLALLYAVPATLGFLMKSALRGGEGDDEETLSEIVRENISYAMSTMIIVRELGGIVQGFRGYEGPAGARFFTEIGKLVKELTDGEADEALARALNRTAGIVFHYPAGQVDRTVRGVISLKEGETKNPGAVFFGPPPNR